MMTSYQKGAWSFAALCVAFLFSIGASAQTLITVGTGTNSNNPNQYPAPYGNFFFGAKHQMLITAAELNAAGMTSSGDITSFAFEVATPAGIPHSGFEIFFKNTTSTAVGVGGVFETGLTSVFGPATITDAAGWNTHTLTVPFTWDGTSNILVETCFNNTAWTNNSQHFYTTTAGNTVAYNRADNATVCGLTSILQTSANRPNMRFEWNPGNVPPLSNFSANTTSTCSGLVAFTDLSQFNPTSWQWDFGDTNNSTAQNPVHTYTSSGTYTVTLIACNAFGCDTLVIPNYISVNLGGSGPIPASCTPATTSFCCGFGITNFSFSTINNPSADGSAGYEDFTCIQTTVTSGASYTATISTPTPQAHNAAMWIDFNNDGILNDVTERVMTSASNLTHTANVVIPGTAVTNQPLRLRISADYDLQAPPTSCSDLLQGQAEDYTVTITTNTNPPTPDFIVSDTLTCSGTVSFTDLTTNLPTGWFWDFGDATTSNQQNPTHTYLTDGTYTVTLTASNAFGSNQISYVALITVNTAGATIPASCTPSTLAYCCDYGITNVTFNTINYDSPDGSEGYADHSCDQQTSVFDGSTTPISVRTNQNSAQDTKVWVDWNNDGTLDNTAELAFVALNAFNPAGSITVPNGTVLNTPLRMRVMSDIVGATLTPCANQQRGQTEDYTVTILPSPPFAGFMVDTILGCDANFAFTDTSTGNPTSWAWNFGDANTSTAQNPTHTYSFPGSYLVTLTATNANGSTTANLLVEWDPSSCTVYNMPTTGVQTVGHCSGTLYDDGGPTQNYSGNTDGTFTIAPAGAQSITLNFNQWDFVQSQPGDWLHVHDGPTTASPLIGSYTGNAVPNGGTITSTGGSITLRQETNFNIEDPGFALTWTCVALPPVPSFTVDSLVTCVGTVVFTDQSTNNPTAWAWDFGDNGSSSVQNPTHTYTTPGNYTVWLVATNPNGSDSTSIIVTYDPNACLGPAPTADFTSNVTFTCTGVIEFTDQSIDNPVNWQWDFGDSGTSSDQNPTHAYSTPGTYDVTLLASNGSGSDTEVKTAYIIYDPSACDTSYIPVSGGGTTETACDGVIMDNGGVANYTDNTDGSITIAPSGAVSITLEFLSFNMILLQDSLYIYDGPTTSSPLIGAYSGNSLPNGGTVVSTASSITVRQVSDATANAAGFEANWTCAVGLEQYDVNTGHLALYPNPARDQVTIDYVCGQDCSEMRLSITNTIGQEVFIKSINGGRSFKEAIDVSQLSHGVYTVSVNTPNGRIVKKLVIQ